MRSFAIALFAVTAAATEIDNWNQGQSYQPWTQQKVQSWGKPAEPSYKPWDPKPAEPSYKPWETKPAQPSYKPWETKPAQPSHKPWDTKPALPQYGHGKPIGY